MNLDNDLRILDEIESVELGPLSWGLVDGGFGDDELLDLLDDLAEQFGDTRAAEKIRDSLCSRSLITESVGGAQKVWRTRTAETLRLLVRLRQLFPQHVRNGGWRGAPSLVSDFRFLARSRQFPDRGALSIEDFRAVALADVADTRVADAFVGLTDPASGVPSYSAFQARAASAILRGADSTMQSATLVSAGTGAGKTKAFYLPALAHVASLCDTNSWTKLLAIYPRNELLKDQLQKALGEIRTLRESTGVQLTVGAFFGPTPTFDLYEPKYWPEESGRRVCPFIRCPKCDSAMAWVGRPSPSLACTSCSECITSDELLLTRTQMQNSPPDVLLTTTEMMNRHLSNDYNRRIFGGGMPVECRPHLLLLDEVHTYTGTTGAHIAMLLRRWRRDVGKNVHTVGLSATVVDGGSFLGDIIGVPEANVTVVQPDESELVAQGKEYLVTLRGDAAAGAALLSTTIQAAMLFRRVLDRPGHEVSGGAFGTKSFVFTDDLDVTNRLLHFLRNAEGLTDRGKPDPRQPDGSLANLRSDLFPDYSARQRLGQAWDISREIGHTLNQQQSSRIELTSSQDPGLQRNADIVVATASLEVGLDDDSVGMVLQHKAPRDAAGFIQRRGRAGRQTRMRPWTAVVLSDYGRDRRAFASWETLFDPELDPIRLPIRNRHILRIQATYCLIEWLADRLRLGGTNRGYIWDDLRDPTKGSVDRRKKILDQLITVLEHDGTRDLLTEYVSRSLDISVDEVHRLMWDPPRAVLGAVVPTMIRRLKSDWLRSGPGGPLDHVAREPFPDFLPSALFADLQVPEVQVEVPQFQSDSSKLEPMGVLSALREFAPGRVSHRFAPKHSLDRLWIPAGPGPVDVNDVVDSDIIGAVESLDGEIRVRRPRRIRPTNPPGEVDDASNARPIWTAGFDWVGSVESILIPGGSPWGRVIEAFDFAIHQAGGRLTVLRAMTGSDATVYVRGNRLTTRVHFADESGPIALGARIEVDAFRLRVRDPGDWPRTFQQNQSRQRSLRIEWFRHCIRNSPHLTHTSTPFLNNWLADLATAVVVQTAARSGDISDGIAAISGPDLAEHLTNALAVMYQSAQIADGPNSLTRLQQEIADLAVQPSVAEALVDASQQLVAPQGKSFEAWLRDRFAVTLAGAVLAAVNALDPQVMAEDLAVDLSDWVDGEATLVFSEQQPGGVGIVERIHSAVRGDQRRFWRILNQVAGDSESEHDATRLAEIVRLTQNDPSVADRIDRVRMARSNAERIANWQRMTATLNEHRIELSTSGRTALALRLLRSGTSRQTDAFLLGLLNRWDDLEQQLGVEIDHRLFAFVASEDEQPEQVLGFSDTGGEVDRTWRHNALLGLLWPRNGTLRSEALSVFSPFSEFPPVDRALLDEYVAVPGLTVTATEVGANVARQALAESGELFIESSDDSALRSALIELLVTPIHVGVLERFPRVVAARRRLGGLHVEVEVAEVLR